MSADPFQVLGVGSDADDEAIRQSYLALVRRFSPERDPERFQEIRAAYEAIGDRRARLRTRLLRRDSAALPTLLAQCLEATEPTSGRVSRQCVNRLLREALVQSLIAAAPTKQEG